MKRRTFLATAVPLPWVGCAEFNAVSTKRAAVRVAPGDDRFHEHVRFGGSTANDFKISGTDTGGQWSVCEFGPATGKGGPPLHVHHHQDEWFYILEGEFEMQVGSERFHLKAGDSVLGPRLVAHTWAKVGEGSGRLLCLFQPAGTMEEFFRKVGQLTERPSPEEFQKLFRAHGMEIVGDPLIAKSYLEKALPERYLDRELC